MPLSQYDLQKEIIRAKDIVELHAAYRHYKSSDKTYIVKDIVINEADESPLVIYQAQYGEYITFARPLNNWLDSVVLDGVATARFIKL